MNQFTQAVESEQNKGLTYNLGATNVSSLNRCVDLFSVIGNRNQQFSKEFELAYQENKDVAIRILLWARDIRGGTGERQTFRNLLKYLEQKRQDTLLQILSKVPEVGRWDDLLVFEPGIVRSRAFGLIADALYQKNALCAKWMPRQSVGKAGRKRGIKGRQEAVDLRKSLGLTPKEYRKLLASATKAVETQMCSGAWKDINYSHVPSLAAARYQKAFNKHDPEGYNAYKEALADPENKTVKISASAIYPYDVIKSVDKGDQKVAMAQWAAVVWPIVIFLLLISGLMYGFFTPTEAGSIGAFAVLVLCLVKGDIHFKGYIRSVREALRISCMVLLLIAFSAVLGHFIAVTNIPQTAADWIMGLPVHRAVIMVVIFLAYLLGGSFIDDLAFMILATPIFFPMITQLGYDPLWAGIMVACTVCIGSVIPPVAICVFVVRNITREPMNVIYQGVYPFLVSMIIRLARRA